MIVRMFNVWYFFWILIAIGIIVGLYFLLKNRSFQTKKWALFSIFAFALVLHFLKFLIPPYSTNESILYRDSWFINICAANIALFPFMYLSKNTHIKDYMYYLGLLGGGLALLYPTEALNKTIENPEYLDMIRFYLHHISLFCGPLLMIMLKVHTLSYKRVLSAPIGLLLLMLFIMLNQVLQSELGFVALRGDDFFGIGYKNTSFIWGPGDDALAQIFVAVCPEFFRVVPVGEFQGQEKFWPWFWLIVPIFLYVTPIAFGLCMIFDWRNFSQDVKAFLGQLKKSSSTLCK